MSGRHFSMISLVLLASSASVLACTLHQAHAPADHSHAHPTHATLEKLGTFNWAGPAISGSWYAPTRSGEGIIVQALEDGSVIAIWFTFPPEGSTAKQAWILAQGGAIDGSRVRFDQVFTVRGPRFGPGFDPAARVIEPWGTLELNFGGCNEVQLSYSGPASWGSATRTMQRLTSIDELGCNGKTRLTASGARAMSGLRQRSAAWYDPSHSGEGWFIEELPGGQTLSYWFTYDENGDQAWTVGVAAQGDLLNVQSSVRPIGTHFGSAFDASEIDRQEWGSYALAFNGCDRGQLQYASTQSGFGSGTLNPQRLTRLAGAVCLEAAPAAPVGGNWSARAVMPGAQSEVATATLGGAFHVASGFGAPRGFKRYDPVSNSWTTLADTPGPRDHAMAVSVAGSIFLTGGFPTNNGGDQSNAGWKYLASENRWEPAAGLPLFAASGGATLNGFGWFGNSSGELAQYDARLLRSRIIAADSEGGTRDHSQLVAFMGELWMIGGRRNISGETGRVSIFDPASETWRAGPSLQFPRGGFSAAASDSALIVAGGEVVVSGLFVRHEVEAIAAGADTWVRLPDLPIAVHGVGGAISGNAFYALGGSTLAGGVRNGGDVQRYQWAQ